MKVQTAVVLLAAGLLQACAGLPQEPVAGMDLEAEARGFVEEMHVGEFEAAARRFGPEMDEAMPPARLQESWSLLTGQVGALERVTAVRQEEVGQFRAAIVASRFERATIDIKMVFDARGHITGLWFLPGLSEDVAGPPAYAEPDRFEEVEVTVGRGEWAAPGTLSLPVGEGPFPAVVLVHGSGPQDRDQTVGGVKPFRDLAWGLASRGVAVLRYEKRTYAHRDRLFALQTAITVREETIDDALAAAELLRGHERVDRDRIFLLGHSLGAMLAPRIAAEDEGIAGFILMAAPARPLEDAILHQTAHVFGLDGELSETQQSHLRQIEQQVARIKRLRPTDADSGEVLLGAAPAYWLDLRGYDAPRRAADMRRPLLVLHGGRDYQVTDEDFSRWHRALHRRDNVTLRDYPDLNHLFISGEGRSTPAEYQQPANVSEVVVRDIARWIRETGR